MTDEREAHLVNAWHEAQRRQVSNAENLDRALLTLSSAGLAVSVAVIPNLVPFDTATQFWNLLGSWGLFAVSIFATLASFLTSQRGLETQIAVFENEWSEAPKDPTLEKKVDQMFFLTTPTRTVGHRKCRYFPNARRTQRHRNRNRNRQHPRRHRRSLTRHRRSLTLRPPRMSSKTDRSVRRDLMIEILWLNLQPTDQRLNDFQTFHYQTDPLSFEVSVFNGECPLTFRLCRDAYDLSATVQEKVNAINTALKVDSGGHVVAIDRYPGTQFREGAWKTEVGRWSSYDFEADFENAGCACVVLSIPGKKPMLLDAVRFACDARGVEGGTPEAIVFHKDAVLSVRCPHCSPFCFHANAPDATAWIF